MNNPEVQIYSLTDGTDTVGFKFFADRKACLADADGSLDLPKRPAIARAPLLQVHPQGLNSPSRRRLN